MKLKEYLMVLAIAILGALFVGLLYDYVFQEPKYEDYCKASMRPFAFEKYPYGAKESCPNPYEADGAKIQACYDEKGEPRFELNTEDCQVFEKCDFCNKYYQDARNEYERKLFLFISPIALLFVLFGIFYGFEIVANAFILSGILLLIYSTARYFADMSKLMRLIVIFLELILLLFITFKKMRKRR